MTSVLICLLLTLTMQSASSMTSEERLRMTKLERSVRVLSTQLMMTQLAQEEMRRSDGDSGIKQVRLIRDGTRPYYTNTHSGPSVAAMHDHADMPRTCGMGEFEAVLNGVHFRTRHNDYILRMPARTGEYHGTEAIQLPPVPPTVLQKASVGEQVKEMKEWFRAWMDGDTSQRDYRPYFKPVLCYLEGAWTTDVTLDEPFHSERHKIDAKDLQDLQDKIRFMAYTGYKNNDENLAFLPSMILNITDGVPVLAQWNYRILCHPLKHDLKLKDIKPVDDLGNRMASGKSWEEYVKTRSARFVLNPFPEDKLYKWNMLDKLMKQIPGKNNYGARLTDVTDTDAKLNAHNSLPLNTAYYNRWYKFGKAGAMGEKVAHRGFADRNLFVAETTQPRVAPVSVEHCRAVSGRVTCVIQTKRVSYAIPLEVIYLTPLHLWNPYGLQYKGANMSPSGKTVTAGGRKGSLNAQGAYNGTNSRHFYQTPSIFFRSAKEIGVSPADTVKGVVGVLDPQSQVRSVVASGVRIFLPEIQGLGLLRTRYPIMPVYAEGNTVWKELEALREMVMNMKQHQTYFRHQPAFLRDDESESVRSLSPADKPTGLQVNAKGGIKLSGSGKGATKDQALGIFRLQPTVLTPRTNSLTKRPLQLSPIMVTSKDEIMRLGLGSVSADDVSLGHVTLVTSPSSRSYVTMHVHTVDLSPGQLYSLMKQNKRVAVRTTLEGGHSHLLEISFNRKTQYFHIHKCDRRAKCWDGHGSDLEKLHTSNTMGMSDNLRHYG